MDSYAKGYNFDEYPVMPGDSNTFIVTVTMSDGNKHTYEYKDGSFLLSTADNAEVDNKTGATGYDGKELDYDYVYKEAEGDHSWKYWDVWIQDILNWIDQIRKEAD